MGAWNGGESKVCRCCGRSYDEAAWSWLDVVGYQELTDETDAEIRNCECLSSIAVEVTAVLPREAA